MLQQRDYLGIFFSWESRESIHCIWDAKCEIDMKAFGENNASGLREGPSSA
jgi:hypothetical protein